MSQTFQLFQPSSLQTQAEASQSQNENASDEEQQEDEGEKISFYLKLGKHKKFIFMWFLYFRNKTMNNVNRNKVHNYIYLYNIQDNKENFKKIAEVVNKRECAIYCQILYIIDNCRIVEDSSSITVVIDLTEHWKLLENITKLKKKKKIEYEKS